MLGRILQWNHLCLEIFFLGSFLISNSISLMVNKTTEMTFCIGWAVAVCYWGVDPFHVSCHIHVCRIHNFPVLSSWCLQAWTGHPLCIPVISNLCFLFFLFSLTQSLLEIIDKSQLFISLFFSCLQLHWFLLVTVLLVWGSFCCCSSSLRLETSMIDLRHFLFPCVSVCCFTFILSLAVAVFQMLSYTFLHIYVVF